MTGRRVDTVALVSAGLLIAGCSGDDGGSAPVRERPDFVSTGVKAPAPCRVVDASIIDELVGSARGVVEKSIDPSQAVSSAQCTWDGGAFQDEARKQGTVDADVTVELMHPKGVSPYSGAKAAYDAFVSGKSCRSIAIAGSDACWYQNPSPTFSVVVWKNYVTVSIDSTATGSPAVTAKRIDATVKRIAENVAAKLP